MTISRRALIGAGLSTGAIAALGVGAHPAYASNISAFPFTLGVASGDPTSDGVVLWTRLAPEPLLPGFGMAGVGDVQVLWQIATDERMADVVRAGAVVARSADAHAVHVEVRGLEPDRHYWYRFRVGSQVSRIGRTRTFPAVGAAVSQLRFATFSCANLPQGRFAAYAHAASQDLDVVLHLGDYIYEAAGAANPVAGADRRHLPFKKLETLEDFRIRHTQYRLDPGLQEVHAAHPFIVVPDDHEVTNNMHVETSQTLKANGYRAYWEHMPLRFSARPKGDAIQLFRSLEYGSLAAFNMLDTRQYRSRQLTGDFKPLPPEAFDPNRTILGAEQERWLFDRMSRSASEWNLLAQQVYFAALDMAPGDKTAYNTDKWDGYPVARDRLAGFLHQADVRNPISLAGDCHSAMVNDITLTHENTSPVVASEFIGSSVTSQKGNDAQFRAAMPENPEMLYYNGSERGYLVCEVTPERFRGDLWFVDDVLAADSGATMKASYAVESGQLGAQQI
ncbi:alkaline phosphatase D family protein [Streptomyces sp. NPDC001312]|uniref:alkaline phosphatase D family protein n=1 Tax=Streptomyces sp. NPDC001312 TaxID=3364561 RepID=UPI00369C5A73